MYAFMHHINDVCKKETHNTLQTENWVHIHLAKSIQQHPLSKKILRELVMKPITDNKSTFICTGENKCERISYNFLVNFIKNF